ncbi:hypothetical protein [Paenibacillus taiwanensis]|uniref:hypothetical protein n=1 Tax=Paenibacillus taiwanensis TaxID=401638 RepID=UPI00041123D8|nr:hypothetical protein [Paenibacillus taiwanensis]
MQYWTSSPEKTKPVTVTLADGLNQSVESIEIKDSQTTSVVNMDSSLYPTVQVREGYTLHSQHTGYINRLFKFKGELYCGNGKGLYKLSGSSWVAVYEYSDINNDRLWDSAQFFDGSKLYFIDGALQLREYDGSTLTTLGSAPANSAFMTTHANRFFLANRNDNLLSFSALRLASDWTSTNKYTGSGKITIESADGLLPTGLTTFAGHVILFKRDKIYELFGQDSTNFEMNDPVEGGCVSDRTILPTKYGLYFLGVDGLYRYLGGTTPVKMSDNAKHYMRNINLTYAHHCCAGFDGRFIYLTLVTGTNTMPNVTLKHDVETGAWWVESYVATSYFLDGQTLYFGTLDGKIMRMGGTTDNGAVINWSIETKPFSDGDETVRKAIHKLWVVADVEVGSTLSVAYAGGTEGGTWVNVKTEANGTGQIQSMRIPVIVRTPETWFRLKLIGSGKVKIHRIIREVSKRGN